MGVIYDPESGKYITEKELSNYEKLAQKRADRELSSGTVQDLSGPLEPGVGEAAIKAANTVEDSPMIDKASALKGVAAMQKSQQSGGDGMGAIGSGLTTAGVASANPWLVGAGLGLSTISSVRKGEQAQREARYKAEVERINARQEALNKLANLASGLKA